MSAYWQDILSLAALNAIAAWGVSIAIRSGQLSVGHAAFAGIGAYLAGILSRDYGWSVLPTMVLAFIVCLVVGGIFRALFLRLDRLLFAIATLMFGQIAVLAASTFDPGRLGGAVGLTNVSLQLSPVLGGCLLALAMVVELTVLRGSAFDLRMRLASEEPTLVALGGHSPARLQVIAFAISAAVVGLTGVLWVHLYGDIQPSDLGFSQSFLIVVYAVVGGAYSGYGAAIGAIVLTLLPQISGVVLQNQNLALGVILLVVIVFRRGGLLPARPVRILDRLGAQTLFTRSAPESGAAGPSPAGPST